MSLSQLGSYPRAAAREHLNFIFCAFSLTRPTTRPRSAQILLASALRSAFADVRYRTPVVLHPAIMQARMVEMAVLITVLSLIR